jgi:L-gulonate 3-dehydrogenase
MAKVAVIGSGFVGRAWAISFARARYEVALWDQDKDAPAKALAYIERLLPELEANDLLNGAAATEVATRIRVVATLESALEGTVHVQENTPEDVEVKRAVFARLDAAAPTDTVLASSTSAILPSAFTENLKGRARCLVVHPINPPYLIPAAEVVPAPWTDPGAVARTADFLRSAGHAPIVMKRELDGFVMNRLQGALLEEAFRLVEQGYAGVEDVDIGIREGLALRWSFMGRSRPSTSMLLPGCATTPPGIRASIPASSRRHSGASIGAGQSWTKSSPSVANAWPPTNSANARLGEIAA